MKKHLFFAAMVCVALASCVKNDVEAPQAKDVKIGFSTPVLYSNLDTKANVFGEIGSHKYAGTETVYSYPREEKFMIFAVEHDGNLTSWGGAKPTAFNKTAIAYNPSLDAWAPIREGGGFYYWPDNKKLSFAAMSPAELGVKDAVVDYKSTGLEIKDFVVADNPAVQYDVLYSERSANKTAADMVDNGAQYYGGIPIYFKHALTSIHFSLKTDATETVTLTSIVLRSAKNAGTFNENFNEAYDENNEDDVLRTPQWTVAEDAAKKDYTSFTGSVDFPINAQYVSALAALNGTDDNDVSHPLLLMPQTLGNDVVVDVTYTVGGTSKTRTVQLNQYPQGKDKDGNTLTPITKWEVGTKYTYRLVYSKEAQKDDIIYFAPETADWTDGGIIEVIL
jgi:hypothetical protein